MVVDLLPGLKRFLKLLESSGVAQMMVEVDPKSWTVG